MRFHAQRPRPWRRRCRPDKRQTPISRHPLALAPLVQHGPVASPPSPASAPRPLAVHVSRWPCRCPRRPAPTGSLSHRPRMSLVPGLSPLTCSRRAASRRVACGCDAPRRMRATAPRARRRATAHAPSRRPCPGGPGPARREPVSRAPPRLCRGLRRAALRQPLRRSTDAVI